MSSFKETDKTVSEKSYLRQTNERPEEAEIQNQALLSIAVDKINDSTSQKHPVERQNKVKPTAYYFHTQTQQMMFQLLRFSVSIVEILHILIILSNVLLRSCNFQDCFNSTTVYVTIKT